MRSVMIATPCYGGNLSSVFVHSFFRAIEPLKAAGYWLDLQTRSAESLIPRVRNAMLAHFIGRQEFGDLLWIDADIGFEPELLIELLRDGGLMAAAAVPLKGPPPLQFSFNCCDLNDVPTQVHVGPGQRWLGVSAAATGLMLMRRAAVEELAEVYSDLSYENDIPGYNDPASIGNFYDLFGPTIHPVSRRYLSEDYAICHRWAAIGGHIDLLVAHSVQHAGRVVYAGAMVADTAG